MLTAIPKGHVRATSQRRWLAEVQSHAGTAALRSDAHRNLLAVAHVLAAFADWEDYTTRPTWAVICARSGLARRTVARWISWLQAAGLLVTVAHGTTSDFSPGVLRGKSGEVVREAALYVLIYPTHFRLVNGESGPESPEEIAGEVADEPAEVHGTTGEPGAGFGVDENGTPSWSPKGTTPAHAREDSRNCQDPESDRPDPAWPANQRPASKAERRCAALEARRLNPLLRQISTAYVAALFREAHLAGWTLADILHALDTQPDGTPWPHTDVARHIPGFIRHRQNAWRNTTADGSGPFLPSPSQRATAEQHRLRARARARTQAAAAAQAAATPAPEAAVWADRVRAELRASRARRASAASTGSHRS